MVFSSIVFLFYFLPLFLALFFVSNRSKFVLLCFSLLFYAWGEPAYVALMVASIMVNYALGLAIEASRPSGRDRLVVTCGLVLNMAPLTLFKYGSFILDNLNHALGIPIIGSPLSLLLPLGISFYTFHSISYLIDVYRRDTPAEHRFINLAVYISMFPQLISGPIIRYKTIAGDLHHPVVTPDRMALGIRTFLIGLGFKVLIANAVALPADLVFNLPMDRLSTSDAWIGIISYTLQIYYDFNGYSTMAIGLGLMVGYRFPLNFDHPYVSQSITEFWRRWHMTLSQWFRDYLYIPLGGNRGPAWRTYLNLVVVFLLCGIWHGAAWTFVAWGLYHGAFLVLERVGFNHVLAKLPAPVRVGYAMAVVAIGWVLFRSNSFGEAAIYLRAMAGFGAPHAMGIPTVRLLHVDVILATLAGLALAGPWLGRWGASLDERLAFGSVRVASLVGLVAIFIGASMSLAGGTYNPFIYFRF